MLRRSLAWYLKKKSQHKDNQGQIQDYSNNQSKMQIATLKKRAVKRGKNLALSQKDPPFEK